MLRSSTARNTGEAQSVHASTPEDESIQSAEYLTLFTLFQNPVPISMDQKRKLMKAMLVS